MAKRTQRAVAQGTAKRAEQDIVRGISGSEIPTEQVTVEETTQPATRARVEGVAGVTQTPTGKFFYTGTAVPANFGTTAFSTPTGQSSTSNVGTGSTSAFDKFRDILKQYGMESLSNDIIKYKQDGLTSEELFMKLRTESPAYKRRFAANEQRINKGLRALSEAEYLAKEDAYQDVMRRYGLPESYYTKGELGRQEGFEKLIAGDVSAAELEDRVALAQERVAQSSPEVRQMLKQYYPEITTGDVLAYVLDPQKTLNTLKRKVAAAEVGGAALQAGLDLGQQRAEELLKYGVTQQKAQQVYQAIGGGLQRGSELASVYGESPYTQATAEQELFGLQGSAEAEKKRKKISGLEQATFGGQTGAGGALQRDRAGAY